MIYRLWTAVAVAAFIAFGTAGATLAQDAATKKVLDQVKKDINAHKGLSAKTKAYAIKSLLPLSTNALFVKETLAQNAKKMPMAEITRIDNEWMKAESLLPIQKEKMNNVTAGELKKLAAKMPAVLEAFVMDDQGGVVGENNLTSDYWQGDEEKWTGSFNKGKGGVDAGKEKFDKSANATIQQVSLPIIDKGGKVIGAVTWGVAVSKL
jgi:hypothetical protein